MSTKPSPAEVDCVAFFVEAALQLRVSPFFHEDHRQLTLTANQYTDGTVRRSASLADENILRSTLMPFRRIWLRSEDSNFRKIRNILRKYADGATTANYLDMLHRDFSAALNEYSGPFSGWTDLKPEGVLDLFLNTRYAHLGKRGRQGRFTRADFEKHQQQAGEEKFDWLFEVLVFGFGIIYFNLNDAALSALEHWYRHGGIRPSFEPQTTFSGAFPWEGPARQLVERSTPGWTPRGETPGERLGRYLRRDSFKNVSTLLHYLEVDGEKAFKATVLGTPVREVIRNCGFELAEVGELRAEEASGTHTDMIRFAGCGDGFLSESRRGSLALHQGRVIKAYECAIPVLEDELARLQKLMLEGETPAFRHNPPDRFKWQAPA